MEVKIGIADSNRELVFKTGMEPDDVHKRVEAALTADAKGILCLLYTSPSPRDRQKSRMPSSA